VYRIYAKKLRESRRRRIVFVPQTHSHHRYCMATNNSALLMQHHHDHSTVRSRNDVVHDVTKTERLTAGNDDDNNNSIKGGTNCDAAFFTCLGVDGCSDCYFEMQTNDIDWAGVTATTACETVLDVLHTSQLCLALDATSPENKSARELFCGTFHSCVIFDNNKNNKSWDDDYTDDTFDNDSDDEYNDDSTVPAIDCSTLKECPWPRMHKQFTGDGICHNALEGCYTTAICNYDGGDCCADTCHSSGLYAECGTDGFVCRNPASANCELQYASSCPNALNDNDNNNDEIECNPGETLYRLVMYNSFGDS
jgi:hypothetical protein